MRAKIMIVFATAAALAAGPTANVFAFSGGVSHVVTHPATRDQRAVGAEPVRGRHVGAPILTEFPDLSAPRSSSAEENLVPHHSDDGGSK